MKQNINPIMIAIAVVVLLGFCYFMYQATQPNVRGPYDPRNGPPAYAKKGGAAMGAPQAPGQPVAQTGK